MQYAAGYFAEGEVCLCSTCMKLPNAQEPEILPPAYQLSNSGSEPTMDPVGEKPANDRAVNETERNKTKKIKIDEKNECLICGQIVGVRVAKHLRIHKQLEERDVKLLSDFYRTKNADARTHIYQCSKCYTRFQSKQTHMLSRKCDGSSIELVPNFQSRG